MRWRHLANPRAAEPQPSPSNDRMGRRTSKPPRSATATRDAAPRAPPTPRGGGQATHPNRHTTVRVDRMASLTPISYTHVPSQPVHGAVTHQCRHTCTFSTLSLPSCCTPTSCCTRATVRPDADAPHNYPRGARGPHTTTPHTEGTPPVLFFLQIKQPNNSRFVYICARCLSTPAPPRKTRKDLGAAA